MLYNRTFKIQSNKRKVNNKSTSTHTKKHKNLSSQQDSYVHGWQQGKSLTIKIVHELVSQVWNEPCLQSIATLSYLLLAKLLTRGEIIPD